MFTAVIVLHLFDRLFGFASESFPTSSFSRYFFEVMFMKLESKFLDSNFQMVLKSVTSSQPPKIEERGKNGRSSTHPSSAYKEAGEFESKYSNLSDSHLVSAHLLLPSFHVSTSSSQQGELSRKPCYHTNILSILHNCFSIVYLPAFLLGCHNCEVQ
jgi:hypothetical protein